MGPLFLSNVVQLGNMADEKKKETKIEKKDEFGNTVEKTKIEEKEEDDDWPKSSNFFIIYPSLKAFVTKEFEKFVTITLKVYLLTYGFFFQTIV